MSAINAAKKMILNDIIEFSKDDFVKRLSGRKFKKPEEKETKLTEGKKQRLRELRKILMEE